MARRHRHHRERFERKDSSDMGYSLKWFVFWFLVYGALIWLFELIRVKYNLFEAPAAHYLLLGLFLRVVSKFIFCAVKKRTFSFRGVFSWTIIYALLLFVINLLLGEFNQITNQYAQLAITSAVFSVVVMFLRRANMKFDAGHKKFKRAPSQIFTGIALIVFGILCWRFSKMVFIDWFGWVEGMAWSLFIGFALIIAGFLVLLAWWRNNVLQHRFGLKIGKW